MCCCCRVTCVVVVGSHENPELVWNDEAREKVSESVRKMAQR